MKKGEGLLLGLVVLVLVGVGSVMISTDNHFLEKLGEATLIAAILAAVVDPFLKNSLAREISEDVFKHVIGHNVPDSIVAAVKEMLRIPFVRNNFVIQFSLSKTAEPIGAAYLVMLTITTDYEVENVTRTHQNFLLTSRIEKGHWGKPSEIKTVEFGGRKLTTNLIESPGHPDEFLKSPHSVEVGPATPVELRRVHTERIFYAPGSYSHVLDFLEPVTSVTLRFVENKDFRWSHDCKQAPWIVRTDGAEGGISWIKYDGVQLAGQHVRISWQPK